MPTWTSWNVGTTNSWSGIGTNSETRSMDGTSFSSPTFSPLRQPGLGRRRKRPGEKALLIAKWNGRRYRPTMHLTQQPHTDRRRTTMITSLKATNTKAYFTSHFLHGASPCCFGTLAGECFSSSSAISCFVTLHQTRTNRSSICCRR